MRPAYQTERRSPGGGNLPSWLRRLFCARLAGAAPSYPVAAGEFSRGPKRPLRPEMCTFSDGHDKGAYLGLSSGLIGMALKSTCFCVEILKNDMIDHGNQFSKCSRSVLI